MTRVKAISFPGIRAWFYSNDHIPPHFHIQKAGEWEAKVEFLSDVGDMFKFEPWSTVPSSRLVRRMEKIVALRRESILDEWSKIHEARS